MSDSRLKDIQRFSQRLNCLLQIRYVPSAEILEESELIFKGFRDATGENLGQLVRLGDLDWQPYRDIIVRYGGDPPPLNRIMITPRHLSEADQLIKIFEQTE